MLRMSGGSVEGAGGDGHTAPSPSRYAPRRPSVFRASESSHICFRSIGTAWHGDYHMNYNTQQPFWVAFSSNHVDKHLAYVDLVDHLLPTWEQMEKVGEYLKLLTRPQVEAMVKKQAEVIERYKELLG